MSRQSAHESGKVVSPTHRPPLPPGNIPGTHFCQKLSQPQNHSAAGRIKSMKNSNDTIGNRTRDLPTCSAVSQPTALPRVPRFKEKVCAKPQITNSRKGNKLQYTCPLQFLQQCRRVITNPGLRTVSSALESRLTWCGRNFFLLTMNFILFTNQGYPLQNSSLGQLHSDGGVVSIFRNSAGRLLLVYLSVRRLRSSGYYSKYQIGALSSSF